MNTYMSYIIIAAILIIVELIYFKIADHFNIIDRPNERSSHSTIVRRGGGIIFTISMIIWAVMNIIQGHYILVMDYFPFLCGLLLISVISFIDDIKSMPDRFRLFVQFIAMVLMYSSLGLLLWEKMWIVSIMLFVCVGAINVINFMDGINGITAGYALSVLVPLTLLNNISCFMDSSYLVIAIIGVVVFCLFNFRPKGKAKCFAGDVGSISIAFIMLFSIGKLIVETQDLTYLIFMLVYGIDGCFTIIHRIILHEKLGEAHRKHAYQIMANELKIGHIKVTLLYMTLQFIVSLGFIYLCPNTILAHWIYLFGAIIVLGLAYILFKKKYYHLHEEYLASLKNKKITL